MDLIYSKQEEVPESSKDNFVEFQQGEDKVWMHKDLAESKKQAFRLQGDLTTQKTDLDGLKTRLQTFEDDKKKAADDAEIKRLEKLKSNNQHDEIIDDLKAKLADAEANKAEIDANWKSKYNNSKKDVLVAEIANLATEASANELKRLVSLDISFDDSGNVVIIGDDGKATSTTFEEYKESIKDGERYPSLIKSVASKGGFGNGNLGKNSGDNKPKFGKTIAGFNNLPIN